MFCFRKTCSAKGSPTPHIAFPVTLPLYNAVANLNDFRPVPFTAFFTVKGANVSL
jgi:hypothetical protein